MTLFNMASFLKLVEEGEKHTGSGDNFLLMNI